MSFDKMLREMVADEVAQALRPVNAALADLRGNNGIITKLASALGQPIKRGPGRPMPHSWVDAAELGEEHRPAPRESWGEGVDGEEEEVAPARDHLTRW